jgi:hypothetical protein
MSPPSFTQELLKTLAPEYFQVLGETQKFTTDNYYTFFFWSTEA